uniref:Putative 4.2 kDa basic salivary protein n=1 Tax=Culex tarsalis TaxID=7177 RepID=B8RIU3_CULTA
MKLAYYSFFILSLLACFLFAAGKDPLEARRNAEISKTGSMPSGRRESQQAKMVRQAAGRKI